MQARVDLCPSDGAVLLRSMRMKKKELSVLFIFSVRRKDLTDHCFKFWDIGPMPGGELYWFKLASPPARKSDPNRLMLEEWLQPTS